MNSDFKIERKFSQKPVKKSTAQDLKESAFYFIVIIGVYYLILGIWRIFTAPFRALFVSDQTKLNRKIEIAKEKKLLRDRILFHSREGEYVPVEKGSCFRYYALTPVPMEEDELDSKLMSVPTIYYKDIFGRYYISREFLDYLQHQLELHLQSSVGDQRKFLRTIRRLYPEFTPRFDTIESEIKDLMEESNAVVLTRQLITEMEKAGIPNYVARAIVQKNGNDPEALKKEFILAKKNLKSAKQC
jgi:hypothetical protein